MQEKVIEIGLKREPGYLYFLDKEGDISRARQGRTKKEEKEKPKKIEKIIPKTEDVIKVAEDILIEKQQPTILTPTVPIEPAAITKAVAKTEEIIAETKEEKEAKIKQLEDSMIKINKELGELKSGSNGVFKSFNSKKELEEAEGKPKKKRFGLFGRR